MSSRHRSRLPLVLAVIALGAAAVVAFVVLQGDRRGNGGTERGSAGEREPRPARLATPDEHAASELEGATPELDERIELGAAAEADGGPDWDLDESVWLTGVVLLPAGVPADEVARIVVVDRPMMKDDLFREDGAAAAAWAGEEHARLLNSARLGTDRRFRIPLPPGTSVAHVAVSGRYSFSHMTTRAVPEAGDVVLAADLGAWVVGRVSTRVPDAEIEGAEIGLGPDLTATFDAFALRDAVVLQTTSAADGTFELRAVPPSAHRNAVVVKHERLATEITTGLDTSPGERRELRIELTAGALVSGKVTDEGGEPVEGATVDARCLGELAGAYDELREVETGPDGVFELAGVITGTGVQVRARKDGFGERVQRYRDGFAEGDRVTGVELVLERGLEIAGRVVFPDGEPAPGVEISALPGLNDLQSAARGSTESRDDGTFTLIGLGDAAYRLTARIDVEADEDPHAGYWSTRLRDVAPGATDVELRLEHALALTGRVTDQAGEPLRRFRVLGKLARSDIGLGIGAERRAEGFEDDEGRFELDDLLPGTWELLADAYGYAASAPVDVELPLAPGAAELVFALERSPRVSGVVLDPEGEPVAQAKVTLDVELVDMIERGAGLGTPTAYTKPDGAFELADLQPGSASLVAHAVGFAASEPRPLELIAGEETAGVVLTLREGGTLRGQVLGPDDEPATDRLITARTPSADQQRLCLVDGEGRFVFEHLEPGPWQVLSTADVLTDDPGDGRSQTEVVLQDLETALVDIIDGEETYVVLGGSTGEAPVRVVGRVVDRDEGIGGAIVSFLPEGAASLSAVKVKVTDGEGRFELVLERPGPYLVTVQHVSGVGRQNSIEFLEDVPETEEYELTLSMPACRISGRVRGPDGDPVAGARVSLAVEGGLAYGSMLGGNYTETQTDDEGRYDIRFLREGTYTVAAGGVPLGGLLGGNSPFGRSVRHQIELGPGQWLDDVDFRLEPAGEIAGRVLGAADKGVPDATVFVRDAEGRLIERFSLVQTDAAGQFSYRGLSPGRYTVGARADARVSAESRPVEVTPGGKAQVTLSLVQGTVLRVVVVDRLGDEINALVSVLDEQGREVNGMLSLSEIMESMESGFSSKEQRVGPLPAGTYRVTARSADGRDATKSVSVSGQVERKVTVRLR